MTNRQKLFIDRVVGLPIVFVLNGVCRVLGKLLHRDHSIRSPAIQTIVVAKFVGMGSILQATPLLRSRVRFNIETKLLPTHPDETVGPEAFARALIAEFRKAGVTKRAVIQSFDYRTLKIVEKEAPEIETVYLTDAKDSDPAQVQALGAKIWSPDMKAMTPEKIAQAHKLGMRVVIWTANEPAEIEGMIDAGVDGIISDYPERVIEVLMRRKLR